MTHDLPGVEQRDKATEVDAPEDRVKTLRKGWRAWERAETKRLDAAEKDATEVARKAAQVVLTAALEINNEKADEIARLREAWRAAGTAAQDALARERDARLKMETAQQARIGRCAEWLMADEYNAATRRYYSDREERARIRATAAAGIADGKEPPAEDAS